MCGIAGWIGSSPPGSAPLDSLAHRGPDDSGSLVADDFGLLHRRLAILDLTPAGRQPMSSPDGRVHLIFNGEIYNYRELRSELPGPFVSASDTEVLLHAYLRWGLACLSKLVGMFALALVDLRSRQLVLARDFLGIKPLYYAVPPTGLAFASEIGPLLEWTRVPRTADPQRLYDYLRLGWTDHAGATMFAHVQQVPAGHSLQILLDGSARTLQRWWSPRHTPELKLSLEESAQRVRATFLENLALHLRSDVPIGTALSGGIDSSALTCGIRHLDPRAELHAVSYVADDAELSEERWIDLVGRAAGAVVHKVHPQPGELVRDLDRLIDVQGEPFASTSLYAQYRVFAKARELGLKVMLDGQGADELFAGYRLHQAARLATLLRQGSWGAAWNFVRQTNESGRPRRVLQALRMLIAPTPIGRRLESERVPVWLNRRWLQREGVTTHGWPGSRSPTMLRDQLEQSLTATSLPMLLRFEDRNSMAWSIESRVPFLTPRLAELALRLPEEHLIGADGLSKRVLRLALKGIVPDEVLERRDKIGFATPEARWLKEIAPWVDATLADAERLDILDGSALRARWRRIVAGEIAYEPCVWRWVNAIRWAQRFDV